MPKVKATKTSKIQSLLQDFSEEFVKSPNNKLYCNLCCSCTVSCNKRCIVENNPNTFKHQKALGSRSELLILHISQTFLRSSNTDFVEEIIKASTAIPLQATS